MKRLGLYLSVLALMSGGCQSDRIDAVETVADSYGCPSEPTVTLSSSNVQTISLDSEATTVSGRVSPNKHQGYSFAATSGQKLQYETEDDLCIWIYTPNNQLVSTTELPVTGKYTLQVAAPRGEKSFELAIGFYKEKATQRKTSRTSKPKASSVSKPVFRFKQADFPKASCGDPKPTDYREYPVSFYPVNVPYSLTNLDKTQLYFCQDAYKKISKDTREEEIQVASFTNYEKASSFARFIGSIIADARVGSPTTIYE